MSSPAESEPYVKAATGINHRFYDDKRINLGESAVSDLPSTEWTSCPAIRRLAPGRPNSIFRGLANREGR